MQEGLPISSIRFWLVQFVVFFLMVQVMPVYGDLVESGGVEGTVTSDSIMDYQENGVTNFLVADGTIQSAVDNANPGDIINLLERICRENVHIEIDANSEIKFTTSSSRSLY